MKNIRMEQSVAITEGFLYTEVLVYRKVSVVTITFYIRYCGMMTPMLPS